jgi:two-component system, OmpR family, sensor kinase
VTEKHVRDRSDTDTNKVLELVAHEIRGPLTVVAGYLEILERPLDEERRTRALAEARQAIERIGVLLDDFVSATCEGDCLAPRELAPVSMAALAADAVSSFECASAHRFALDASCSGEVLGDSVRLRQTLSNLLANAVEYTPDTGRIAVSVSCEGDAVLTAVEDNGPGIPEDSRELIFERFERLEADDAAHPGTGLGLYIVRSIVEAHGGWVRVGAGEGGQGARFLIELPAAPPS